MKGKARPVIVLAIEFMAVFRSKVYDLQNNEN